MSARPFEAWCECPSCERIDCHSMREPSMRVPVEIGQTEVMQWGSETPVRVDVHYDCDDERGFEVIRMCDCGHEWGQT